MFRLIVFFLVFGAIICPVSLCDEEKLTAWEKFTGVKIPDFRFKTKIDSSSNSEIDNFVLEKIVSLESKYYKNNSLNDYEISSRIYYTEIPCVRKYSIMSRWFDVYYILINKCNSSYYHFGGEFRDFLHVINEFFEEKLTEERALGLIDFYLYTKEKLISPHSSYLMLNSVEEIDTLFKKFIDPRDIIEGDSLLFDEEVFSHMLRKLEILKEKFKPIEVLKRGNDFDIEIFTFNFQKFEFWRFRITKKTMEIIERYDVATFFPFDLDQQK